MVLARNRRALIVWANGHLLHQEILTNYDMTHWQAQTIVSVIEAQGGPPVFTVRAEGSLSKWQPDAASWKPMSLALVRGTSLGAADFSEFESPDQRYRIRGDDDFVPIPRDQWVKRPLEDIVDAVLYVGPASGRTSARISRTLCADPAYIKMRLDRIALLKLPEPSRVQTRLQPEVTSTTSRRGRAGAETPAGAEAEALTAVRPSEPCRSRFTLSSSCRTVAGSLSA